MHKHGNLAIESPIVKKCKSEKSQITCFTWVKMLGAEQKPVDTTRVL